MRARAKGYGFAVDHEDALVAVDDLREIAWAMICGGLVGERLDDDGEIRVALADTEDRCAAHAVEWLHHHALGRERAEFVRAAGDDERWAELGEGGREELLVAVPQGQGRLRTRARGLRTLQEIGRVDELHVEGRILALEDAS